MFLEHSQERQKLNAPLKIAKDKDASDRFEFSVPKYNCAHGSKFLIQMSAKFCLKEISLF